MKWKKLKEWWQKKVKKSKKNIIETPISGSESNELFPDEELTDEERESMVEEIMEKLMNASFFQETFEKLAAQPITMLLPYEDRDSFYLFSPTTQSFRFIKAPTEAIVIEASNGRETLCLIHDVPYMVPDKYLKNVGYN
jgi:hypothetical protein